MRRRVVATGQVQGVGFRAGCRRRAEQVGVSGWVRNTPDGAVEAVFDGPRSAVEQLLAWVRDPPAPARVRKVTVVEDEQAAQTEPEHAGPGPDGAAGDGRRSSGEGFRVL